jgi:aspartokinase
VVKFGGSSLADPERLSRAVAAVVNEAKRGTRIAVVVSAMGKTTDVLLNTIKNTSNGKLENTNSTTYSLWVSVQAYAYSLLPFELAVWTRGILTLETTTGPL